MKLSKILANASLLAAFGGAAFAAQAQTTPACVASAGVITETVTAGAGNMAPTWVDNQICTAQPDLFQVKIYKVAVCTAAPTAPTASTAFSAASCTTVFENAAGATVDVTKGVTSELTGTITRPANGTYVAGYVEMSPQYNLKVGKQFGTPTRKSGKDNTVGAYCWTVAGNYLNWGVASQWSASNQQNVTCGTSMGTPGLAVINMNGFPNPTGTATFNYATTVSGQQVGAYLVQVDKKLPATGTSGQQNGVDRMIGVATFAAPVTISNSTTGFNTQFDVSSGTSIVMGVSSQGGQQWVDMFTAGPFSIMMTATQ